MKNLILFAIPFCLFFLPDTASADAVANINPQGRVFESLGKTSSASVNIEGGELLIDSRGRKKKIKLDKNLLRHGDFHISDDGDWIVWILKSFTNGNWNNSENSHKGTVVIIFHMGDELKRFYYKETGFSKKVSSVSHARWIEKADVDFKKGIITLQETLDQNNAGKADLLNFATVNFHNFFNSHPIELKMIQEKRVQAGEAAPMTKSDEKPKSDPGRDFQENMKKYSEAMAEMAQWQRQEMDKLNAKADTMPDKELNQAMEKLTADYNRKLLKANAIFNTTYPTEENKKTKGEDKLLTIKAGKYKAQFMLSEVYRIVPGLRTVDKSANDGAEDVYALWPVGLAPGTMLEVSPSLTVKVSDFSSNELHPGDSRNPHGIVFHEGQNIGGKKTLTFYIESKHTLRIGLHHMDKNNEETVAKLIIQTFKL